MQLIRRRMERHKPLTISGVYVCATLDQRLGNLSVSRHRCPDEGTSTPLVLRVRIGTSTEEASNLLHICRPGGVDQARIRARLAVRICNCGKPYWEQNCYGYATAHQVLGV